MEFRTTQPKHCKSGNLQSAEGSSSPACLLFLAPKWYRGSQSPGPSWSSKRVRCWVSWDTATMRPEPGSACPPNVAWVRNRATDSTPHRRSHPCPHELLFTESMTSLCSNHCPCLVGGAKISSLAPENLSAMGMLGDQCHMEIGTAGRSQGVPIASEKFNKASTDDWDTSRWLLHLQGDGAREMWKSGVARWQDS